MIFVRLIGMLLVLFLLAVVIASLLEVLPWVAMVVGAVVLMRKQSARREKAMAWTASIPREGRWRPTSADTAGIVTEVPTQGQEENMPRTRYLVRYPPDAVHDAIEKSLEAVGAEVRWDRRTFGLAEGKVAEGGLLGGERRISVAFGSLPKGGCWVSVAGDGEEIQAQFRRALDERAGPIRNLVDGYEAAWCRRFNQAMTRRGDPTRVYPDRWICPGCGAVCIGGASCGRCGARIEGAR